MKLAVCNDLFQGWSEDEIFRCAAELGYQGLEIAPFMYAENVNDIDKKTRRRIKEQASRYNLKIAGLHWVFLRRNELGLTHPEKAVRKATREYLLSLIEFCGELGGEVIVVGSPQQRNLQPGVSWEEGEQYAAEIFRACMEDAAQRGVTICIEPLGPAETNFITGISEAIQLVKMVDHPNFQTMVDIKAALTEGRPLTEIIREAADHLYHVHLNDLDGIAPGFGKTDFASIIGELRKINYQRYLSIEVFKLQTSIEETAAKSHAYLTKLLAE